MSASSGSLPETKIRSTYSAQCCDFQNTNLISSSTIVVKVLSFLRLSVAENPMNEFVEDKNWRMVRQSSFELPWSREGLVIDDDDLSLISESLTVVRVPKSSHQFIIDTLRRDSSNFSHMAGLAPMIVVNILETTHITLPLIDVEGKAIVQEYIDDPDEEYFYEDVPVQTEEEEATDQAQFINYLKKLIVVREDINEEDENALIHDWCCDVIDGIDRIARSVTKEEEESKKEEGKREAKEEEKAAKMEEEERVTKDEEETKEEENAKGGKEEMVEEEERACPICLELKKPDETWSEMRCCSQQFHCHCISMWIKGLKKCPWCRSSLPLLLQSAEGFLQRNDSDAFFSESRPGFQDELFYLWHLLAERGWWIGEGDRVWLF